MTNTSQPQASKCSSDGPGVRTFRGVRVSANGVMTVAMGRLSTAERDMGLLNPPISQRCDFQFNQGVNHVGRAGAFGRVFGEHARDQTLGVVR